MRRASRAWIALLVLAAGSSPAAAQPTGRTWLRVSGSALPRAQLTSADGNRIAAWRVMQDAPSRSTVAWLPLNDAPAAVPRQAPGLRPTVVTVPSALSGRWQLVPLPLASWNLTGLRKAQTIHLSRDAAGLMRAASVSTSESLNCGGSAPPAGAAALPLLAAKFSRGVFGPLGNRFGTFAGGGASISVGRVRDARGTVAGLRLAPSFAGGKGWAGFWIELAPPATLTDPAAGLDLSKATAVVLRGSGLRGTLGVSDPAAVKRDEAVTVAILPKQKSTSLRVPLAGTGVDLAHVRSLTLNLTGTGDDPAELDEIWFVGDEAEPPPSAATSAGPRSPTVSGIWIWNTGDFLQSPEPQMQRFDALRGTWQIGEVYLQLPESEWRGASGAGLARLVYEFHRRGVRVHALDGAPWFALAPAHAAFLKKLMMVERFNRYWGSDASFDAIHLDIEPYLLPAFGGPRRASVLESLTSLLRTIKHRHPQLPLWLDVPFWYDEAPEVAGPGGVQPCPARDFLAATADIADGIVVMAYRTAADGADGIAAHAAGEATLASAKGKHIRVAVESVPLPPEDEWLVETGSPGEASVGKPFALVATGSDHLLVTRDLDGGDLAALPSIAKGYRSVAIRFSPGPPPGKITFDGRSGEEMRREVREAHDLLSDAGTPAGGAAYHEFRTLPR